MTLCTRALLARASRRLSLRSMEKARTTHTLRVLAEATAALLSKAKSAKESLEPPKQLQAMPLLSQRKEPAPRLRLRKAKIYP